MDFCEMMYLRKQPLYEVLQMPGAESTRDRVPANPEPSLYN